MLKSAIIITILAFADFQAKVNAAATLTNENLKDQLSFTILEAKNRAFDQVQSIKVLASVNFDNFIVRTNEMVQKSSNDMKILREEFNEANDTSCNKAQADIDDAALKTIAHYQTCVEKVTYYAEADLNSLAFDGSLLTKEIQYAKNRKAYRRQQRIDFVEKYSLVCVKVENVKMRKRQQRNHLNFILFSIVSLRFRTILQLSS
ncbi:uncharacterized protein [Linepithema humile]|uniref:uncharacterized protein isoform X1 n=1 Tax=Linepithema humile TaxID=83485 RepID=UPI00351DFE86